MPLIARTRLLVLVLTLALAAAFAPHTGASAAARHRPAPAHSWATLGLTLSDARSIHFRGNSMPYRWDLVSIAVTLDSALVVIGDLRRHKNRLVELPARAGAPRTIGRRLVGIPLADPAGHRVFWTTKPRGKGLVLHAYDTDSGRSYRAPTPMIVQAVDGGTAYGIRSVGWRSWTPQSRRGLEPVTPEIPDEALLSDVSHGLQAVTGDSGGSLVAADGSVVDATRGGGFGIFDPAGTHQLLSSDRGIDLRDVAQGRWMTLAGLGGRKALSARWSPTGDLVVQTLLHKSNEHRGWDDVFSVLFFDCPMPDGEGSTVRCVPLPVRHQMIGTQPPLESTALGQFEALMPYSRTQAPKAAAVARHLR